MKKLLTRTLAIILTLLMVLPMAAFMTSAEEILPSEDFMEEDGVFHIENASDMLAFAGMAEWYQWYTGKTVSIDANIDMTGVAWTMVTSFRGTLEGNGHCIKNLTVDGTGQVSIFKETSNATIKNIRFLGCTVKTPSGTTGGIAVLASGTTLFENVYLDTTVETSPQVRPGGFIAYTNKNAHVTFKNCVSAATLIGSQHGAGFVAQHTNEGASVEFIDCAFIGDVSQIGKRSTGFVSLCDADSKFTRCISFGKNDSNLQSGDLAVLNRQGGQGENKSKHEFYDCYGITDVKDQTAVVYDNPLGMDIAVYYDGERVYSKECANIESTLADDKINFEFAFKYLIKENTVNFTKEDFKTEYTAFAEWTVTDQVVEYSEGKTVPVIIPTVVKTLIDGSTDVPPPANNETPDDGADQTPDNGSTQTPDTGNTDTEAATEAATDAATEAETEEAKRGCGGIIGVSALAVLAVAGAAVVITRKKED
ncbi:MAG: hypothetical protein E7577_02575 [Ruminococcaceae bacterium]|nr:hypothetical protein [Oscillospiraceae bacterium]